MDVQFHARVDDALEGLIAGCQHMSSIVDGLMRGVCTWDGTGLW